MAGALNVTLEKVGYYKLEGGAEPVSADTIRRATRVAGLTVALLGVILVVCLILAGRHSTI
jgi:cobalamin biosynthesis protein CobD/CbiB